MSNQAGKGDTLKLSDKCSLDEQQQSKICCTKNRNSKWRIRLGGCNRPKPRLPTPCSLTAPQFYQGFLAPPRKDVVQRPQPQGLGETVITLPWNRNSQPGVLWFPGDIWKCLESFLIAIIWVQGGTTIGIQWAVARDGAKHPTVHRTGTHNNSYPTQNVDSDEVEKLYVRGQHEKGCFFRIFILALHQTLIICILCWESGY